MSNPSPRIAVLISGNGSNLAALLRAERRGELGGRIVSIICNRPAAPGVHIGRTAGKDVHIIDHRAYAGRADFDAAVAAALGTAGAQLVVLAGFMRIFTTQFVDRFHGRMINIHPSLLPAFQGLHTHQRALDAGVVRHGASVHFVTPDLDGGPNIAQVELQVMPGEDTATLGGRVLALEHLLLPTVVRWCADGRVSLHGDDTGTGRYVVMLDGQPLPPSGVRLRADGGALVRVSAA